MSSYVKCVKASGIHGKFDFSQTFMPEVNILYGRNGTGKTTLLHILANALNSDYERFAFLEFHQILIEMDDDKNIQITRQGQGENATIEVRSPNLAGGKLISFKVEDTRRLIVRSERLGQPPEALVTRNRRGPNAGLRPPLPASYFPAFRTMIDAWISRDGPASQRYRASYQTIRYPEMELYERQLATAGIHGAEAPGREDATSLARALFGKFVPVITYRSPLEIEAELNLEIRRAEAQIAAKDRELLSTAFESIFNALSKTKPPKVKSDAILNNISQLLSDIEETALVEGQARSSLYTKLRDQWAALQPRERTTTVRANILEVYRKSLSDLATAQDRATANLRRYLKSVNQFLEGKTLTVQNMTAGSRIGITFADGSQSTLQVLSSGEREIVTLLYAATHMNQDKVVLIDEPELSLHVDWQRALLRGMSDQLGQRQIIVCTHSPIIGADYLSSRQELQWQPTKDKTERGSDQSLIKLEAPQ